MRVKPKDGKLYAEVTLRDVVERSDVSDLPMLSEIKHLYEENDELRELTADMLRAMRRMEESAGMDALVGHSAWFAPKLHELGIEVDE